MNKEKRDGAFGKSIIIVAFLVFLSSICFASALEEGTSFGSMGLNSSTYTFSAQLSSQGITQSLEIGDGIQFSRKIGVLYETYTVTLNKISANSVDLIMQNDQSHISLNLGETKKMTLSSSGFYDLLIKLESVSDGKAEITVQTIHDIIQIQQPAFTPSNTTTINQNEDNASPAQKTTLFTKTNLLWAVVVIIILIFIRYIYSLRRNIHSFHPSQHASYRIIK